MRVKKGKVGLVRVKKGKESVAGEGVEGEEGCG